MRLERLSRERSRSSHDRRFHRYRAADRAAIPAEVREGTQRDAILFACGANTAHGLRRTNEDKRKAVGLLLADAEWSKWSDREIARQCSVGVMTVGRVRAEHLSQGTDSPDTGKRKVERGGKTFEQDTSKIGKGTPTGGAAPAP